MVFYYLSVNPPTCPPCVVDTPPDEHFLPHQVLIHFLQVVPLAAWRERGAEEDLPLGLQHPQMRSADGRCLANTDTHSMEHHIMRNSRFGLIRASWE